LLRTASGGVMAEFFQSFAATNSAELGKAIVEAKGSF
jgi:hypothetical protein